MALCGCTIKKTFSTCIILLIIMGLSLAVVGGLLMKKDADLFEDANQMTFVIHLVLKLLIPLGGLLLITAIIGLCGLYNEKTCALKVFSVLVLIMAVVDLVFIILIYLGRDKFHCCNSPTAKKCNMSDCSHEIHVLILMVTVTVTAAGVLLITTLVCSVTFLRRLERGQRHRDCDRDRKRDRDGVNVVINLQ